MIYWELFIIRHIQQYLSNLLQSMAEQNNYPDVSFLTKDLHIWPDFHGNRSPIADATLQGMISGLSLSSDEENLATIYLATIQALTVHLFFFFFLFYK